MRNKSGLMFVVSLAIVSFLASACGPTPIQTPLPDRKIEERVTGKQGGTLTYRLTSAPKTFNYVLAADEPSIVTTLFLLTSRLIEFDHRSQKYVPALAESYVTAADGQTVDVKLRDGLKFSDGHALTSDDVIFTLKAIYDDRTNSPAFGDAMLVNGKQIEAKRVDDVRLQLVFPEKVAAVENYLDNLGAMPRHLLEADLNNGKFAEAWKLTSDPNTIATSGAFTVESATPGERMTLKRNSHYYKKDENGVQLPYLDKLILEVIADPNNTFASLGQGSVDIADRIRGTDFAALSSQSGAVRALDLGPGLGTDHIWFNLNRTSGDGKQLDNTPKYKWFSNKAFRQAVSSAIDRKTIADITLKGLATPLYGFVSPANRAWINPNLTKLPYDLERARALLQGAGFKQQGTADAPEFFDAENNRVEFTLLVPAENEQRKLIAAVVQEDLARLGIKMQVVPIENQAVTERWSKTYDYDAMLFGLSVTGIEPSSYANFLLSSASVHQWQPSQKSPATEWESKIDGLYADQARETDVTKRAAIFNEIQNIISDELPVIPIASRHIVTAANLRIGNYAPSSIFPYSIWNADELFIKQ
ncbi:MAG: ABC transporter substrate-binding protein [Pyrinomonadaceae bacterium]